MEGGKFDGAGFKNLDTGKGPKTRFFRLLVSSPQVDNTKEKAEPSSEERLGRLQAGTAIAEILHQANTTGIDETEALIAARDEINNQIFKIRFKDFMYQLLVKGLHR